MEILNRGVNKADPLKKFEVICQNCSTLIRFSRNEATSEKENITATILYVTCPVCDLTVDKTINKKVDEQLVVEEKYNHIPV